MNQTKFKKLLLELWGEFLYDADIRGWSKDFLSFMEWLEMKRG